MFPHDSPQSDCEKKPENPRNFLIKDPPPSQKGRGSKKIRGNTIIKCFDGYVVSFVGMLHVIFTWQSSGSTAVDRAF